MDKLKKLMKKRDQLDQKILETSKKLKKGITKEDILKEQEEIKKLEDEVKSKEVLLAQAEEKEKELRNSILGGEPTKAKKEDVDKAVKVLNDILKG